MAEELIVTQSQRDDHQLDLTIQLGPERAEQALLQGAKLVSRKAKIPGFRPGKAPFATVLRMFGKEALLNEVLDDLGQEVYREVLDSEKLDPYGQAALNDITTDPITFKLVVPLRPTVDLGDYASIRVEKPDAHVDESDVNIALENARMGRTTLQAVERPAALGDSVMIDIKGAVGETSIMDNKDWELTLRGESGWLPGFDEAFVGLSAGDEKSFDLVYPEDSASRFKGQTATFQVKVKEVKSKVLPALDDEFARSLGDYADMADYRAKTLAEITQQREAEAEAKFNDAAVEALAEKATLKYPPAAVHDAIHDMLHDMESRLANMGYTLEDSLRLQGKTMDAYEKEIEPVAERRLRGRLALNELTKQEGLTAEPAEIDAELERMAGEARDEATARQIREVFGSESGRLVLAQDVLTQKTLARLREIVTGAAPAAAEVKAEAEVEVKTEAKAEAEAEVKAQ